MPREGEGTPYSGLYGKAPPKRGTFFRLQVYGRVGILLFKVYEREGKSVILRVSFWSVKRPKGAEKGVLGYEKDKTTSWFSDLFI